MTDPSSREALDDAHERAETDHWLRSICRDARPGGRRPTCQYFVRGDHVEAANHLYHALAREKVLFDQGEVYRYRSNGVWTPIPKEFLEVVVSDLAGVPVLGKEGYKALEVSHGYAENTTKMLAKIIRASEINRIFEDPDNPRPYGLGFTNGFLSIQKGVPTLVPHAPEHLCRYAYDFAYARDIPHPLLDRFFDVVFRGEAPEAREKLPLLLQEFVGACLFGEAAAYEQSLILLGKGGNGKSEFLSIVRAVFPPGSTSALPPHEWGGDYAVYGLVGKLANFVDEVDDKEISVGAVFKKIVSGQPTFVDRKYHDPFTFLPMCGHIFNVNTLFGTRDTSEGFFRRFLIVPFDHKPLAHEREVKIGTRIAAAERRALVAWAVEGYVRLKAQNGYTQLPRVQQRTAAWRTEADSVRMFICAAFEAHKDIQRFTIAEFYKMFKSWCEDTGHKPPGLNTFARRCRETDLMTDADDRYGRGFSWNVPPIVELMGLMGDHAPEWGRVPAPTGYGPTRVFP